MKMSRMFIEFLKVLNHVYNSKSKHIGLRHNCVRELIAIELLQLTM